MNEETITTPTLDKAVAAEQNPLVRALVDILTIAQRVEIDRVLAEQSA